MTWDADIYNMGCTKSFCYLQASMWISQWKLPLSDPMPYNGLPGWHRVKNSFLLMKEMQQTRFDPWVGKIAWSRKWLRTPAFFPGEFHGRRSLAGYSPWGCRVRHDWGHTHILCNRNSLAFMFRVMRVPHCC